jgi:TolB-like protein/Flp pilus assembly protein TadD
MTNVRGDLQTIRFGAFELDLGAGELRKQGVRVRLQEQPFRILQLLLESPGRLVSREELRTALWSSNSYVDFDQGLNRAINKLREALGDSAESPLFIETLARRGYRFMGDPAAVAAQIRSLLVLPLENLPHDAEQEYFAEGLTEAVTTCLAKISALRVMSRTTAVIYKRANKLPPDIARELGVDGVVQGTVMRSEGRVRISAQLIHAQTDTHLWAESYERDMRDILALQAEVASAIARAIRIKVTADEETQLSHAHVVDPEAYDAYLRGRYFWDKRSPAATRRAIEFFTQAITRDPAYAAAHAGLADCFGVMGWWCYAPPLAGCKKAKTLALRALEMDPNLAEAHVALAWAIQHYDYDFRTAETEFRRAIELDPRYPVSHFRLGMGLAHVGRYEEAIAETKRALTLDPLGYTANGAMCWVYMFAREDDRLLAHAEQFVELHPEVPQSHYALNCGYLATGDYDAAIREMQLAAEISGASLFVALLGETYAVAGHFDEARAILRQLHERSSEQFVTPYMLGRIYAALGQNHEAFRWLNTAYEERAPWMVLLKRDPRMDSLRADPRYQNLVRLMNFPS